MSAVDSSLHPIRIGNTGVPHPPLVFGGSWYIPYAAPGAQDAVLADAIDAAFDGGVRHFDTAGGYGKGRSEELLGATLATRRDQVFLSSKANPPETTAAAMTAAIDDSLRRLGTGHIDLYYIHWPRSGADMRPRMEALERARAAGKIGAVGVSNFSVDQMRQVQEVGRIDAHQLGYNLLWRYAERDVIPFCTTAGIAVVGYSTLAHGILTGKFGPDPRLAPGDQRHSILPFRADVWPHVHAGVTEMTAVAAEAHRPLMHLAIRWALARPGIRAVVVGANRRDQAQTNLQALEGEVPPQLLARLTAISDRTAPHVPDKGNLFNHRP
jgi:myo-inositol catabolism protein IolS